MLITDFVISALENAACAHLALIMPFGMWACMVLFAGLFCTSYWYIPLLYTVWHLYDRETPYRAGRPWPFLKNLPLWKYVASYFPIKLHKTADLDPSKNYLFAFHPHGFQGFGAVINFATNATGFDKMFPGLSVEILTLNWQFWCPFYREYCILAGLGSVSAESIDYKLTQVGPGRSVLIIIGGAAEVQFLDPNKHAYRLDGRKGFVRRALKDGASLVPVISFNEDRIYDVSSTVNKRSLLYYLIQAMRIFFGINIPFMISGRPSTGYLLPFRRPINTVVGAPLDFAENKLKCADGFKKGQDPPEELVDECYEIYLEELRKLYDDHKARFGEENVPLVFV